MSVFSKENNNFKKRGPKKTALILVKYIYGAFFMFLHVTVPSLLWLHFSIHIILDGIENLASVLCAQFKGHSGVD